MIQIKKLLWLSLVFNVGQIISCTFCDIRDGKLPAKIITQNSEVMVIEESIDPRSAIHWLIFPKKHIPTIDAKILGVMLNTAGALGKQLVTSPKFAGTFDLTINNDSSADQAFHVYIDFYSQNKLAVSTPQI